MTLSGATRRMGLGVLALAVMGLAACDDAPRARSNSPSEIAFSILSAQGQASAAPLWQPLLDDLSAALDIKVTARFAAGYEAQVEELARGAVQAAWLSARPAVDAVDGGKAEVIARTVGLDGQDSYRSTLIVRKGSGITLEDVLACGKKYSVGLGDPRSTSASLAPNAYLFKPRNIRPETCFASTRTANHEKNALEVASGILDVAISNTATQSALARQNPVLAADIETLWSSPEIPEGGIVVRSDLDPAVKEKIRGFLLSYGRGDTAQAQRQRRVLASLNYSRFVAPDDDYLDPVRELVADETLDAARAKGDSQAAARAQQTLRRLREKREVQP